MLFCSKTVPFIEMAGSLGVGKGISEKEYSIIGVGETTEMPRFRFFDYIP